jgi:hypothetical protein
MTTRIAVPALLLWAMLGGLAGCGLYQVPTHEDRDAMAACRSEADRVFAARNRYMLSERDSSASPFSSDGLAFNPSAGLSDQYEQQNLDDTCLARSAAGAAAVPGSNPPHP